MAKRQPRKIPAPEKRDGQQSVIGGNNFIYSFPAPITYPNWQEADFWRKFVSKQQTAIICRERISSYLNSLDWQIVPRDSEQRDELKGKIKYYTKLFEKGSTYYNDIDFSSHIEWLIKDLFELPFGTASELGRVDDNPRGRVAWIRPLDAGTLAPTLNFNYPVMQQAIGAGLNPIFLPKDFVARVYLSPRTEIRREGWGYAPPERIYLALEMLSRGDSYYAQLLLNTPEAGILDLGDMASTDAIEWVKSLRDTLFGISPLKIPVLYEHTTDAKWIPFGKPPSEIMYDSTTMKYGAIVCAGYGLTLTDIGLSASSSGGGDTLAGTIRMERISKSSGFSTAKKKTQSYFNKILPDVLKFNWIDYDDEKNVAKGRARLASAQAADILIRNHIFLPSEMRRQNQADGLISIDAPETIDPNHPEFESIIPQFGKQPFGGSKGQSLGDPKPPSGGGQGEIIPQQTVQRNMVSAEVGIAKAVFKPNEILDSLLVKVKSNLSEDEMDVWEEYVDLYLTGKSEIEEESLKSVLDDICKRIGDSIKDQPWVKEFSNAISEKVIQESESERLARLAYEAEEKAEELYITGEANEIAVKLDSEALVGDSEKTRAVVLNSLVDTVSNYAVLVSKSFLMDGRLEVDPTEKTENNIRVSREIGRIVLQNLSQISKSVYMTGRESLIGESNAES